jgi:hypothetical protein
LDIVDGVWTLFFLSNGLRGGKAGGISWLVDSLVDPVGRLCCLCVDEDFVGNKTVFVGGRDSSSCPSIVDDGGPVLLRAGFRLN